MEKDGFVEAPKGRSTNYTTEDELICASWKKVGLGLAVGTEQQAWQSTVGGFYSSSMDHHFH
jgi:hypothetical protein